MTEATIEQDLLLLLEPDGKEKFQVRRPRCKTWCARKSSARNLIENPLTDSAMHDVFLAHPERPRFLSWGVKNDCGFDTEDDNSQQENFCGPGDEVDYPQDTFLEEKENKFSFHSLSCYWNGHARNHEDLSMKIDGDLSQARSVSDEVSDSSYVEHVDAPTIGEPVPFALKEANNCQYLRGSSLTGEGIIRTGIHAPSVLSHPSILSTKKISKSRDRHCTTYLFSVLVGTVVTVVFAIYVVVAIFS